MSYKEYKIFTRNWWKVNKDWSGGLEPDPTARKTTLDYASSEKEAQAICQDWNSKNPAGKLSRKAEYTKY